MIRRPGTRPINQGQLVAEVKGTYDNIGVEAPVVTVSMIISFSNLATTPNLCAVPSYNNHFLCSAMRQASHNILSLLSPVVEATSKCFSPFSIL
ncbi:hypothetical protein BX600DRAFT_470088 [Xylariales sp. PMI_506]|nr:hypothetical protein BX600DRAFT_470088 [Xylariales sp. PMI_506]